MYNLSTHGTRRKIGSRTNEVEQYSPLDDAVKVLIFAINQTNRINPPVTLIRVAPDLFAVHYDSPGWTAKSWEDLASKDVYFRREWVQESSWNYLTSYTYSEHPIMRADQFISLSTIDPDYSALLGLPKTIGELYKLLGIDEKLLLESNRVKGSVKTDNLTVTLNNRILERRQGSFDIWSSNDVVNSKGKKNALRQLDVIGGDIHKLDIDGQEHFFELNNGLWGTFLNNAKGERVAEVPINIATDDNFKDHRVLVGRSCFSCHDLAIKPFNSDQATLLEKNVIQLRTIKPEDSIALAARYDEKSIQRSILTDQQNYRSTIEDLIEISPEKISSMYASYWRIYNEDRVSLHSAAPECGLPDNGLIAILVPSVDPNLLKFLELDENKKPRTLARDVWEDVFDDAMLLKGKPATKKDQVPLPPVGENLQKPLAVQSDIAIVGQIVLTVPKVVGEIQEAKITLQTKQSDTLKSYQKSQRIEMISYDNNQTSHDMVFRFTSNQEGFPASVEVEFEKSKSIKIPIQIK